MLLGERVMARDFARQVAELQIRAFAGSLGPVAFTRSLHEPLHGTRNAPNSTHAIGLPKGRGNSTAGRIVQQSLKQGHLIRVYGDIGILTGRGLNTGWFRLAPIAADEWITDP